MIRIANKKDIRVDCFSTTTLGKKILVTGNGRCNLTNVDLSALKTDYVRNMSRMFYNCSFLSMIKMNKFSAPISK